MIRCLIQSKIKEVLQNIANKNALSYNQVEELYAIRFKFIREKIEASDRDNLEFPTISWMNFGTFFVSNRKKEKLIAKNKKEKDETI